MMIFNQKFGEFPKSSSVSTVMRQSLKSSSPVQYSWRISGIDVPEYILSHARARTEACILRGEVE